MHSCGYPKLSSVGDYSFIDKVRVDGNELQYTPYEYISLELCTEAVKQKGLSLRYVPKKFQTYEVCKTAVLQNGLAIQHVPKELRTRELRIEAVKQRPSVVSFFPEDAELCEIAVKADGLTLKFLMVDLTKELCEMAVTSNGEALKYVPENLKTPEICEIAVKNCPKALQWAVQTPELCLTAVKSDSKLIEFVKFTTNEIYEAVIAAPFIGAGKYLPSELKSSLDAFYESEGYTSFGTFKVLLKGCKLYLSDKGFHCKHNVILECGSSAMATSVEIIELLQLNKLSHPHFKAAPLS